VERVLRLAAAWQATIGWPARARETGATGAHSKGGEAGVISMRFGLTDGQPKTLDEIGKMYGVTRERIQQIESTTMSKLRHPGHGIGGEGHGGTAP
jgi:RNA polymerase primary sigma factor